MKNLILLLSLAALAVGTLLYLNQSRTDLEEGVAQSSAENEVAQVARPTVDLEGPEQADASLEMASADRQGVRESASGEPIAGLSTATSNLVRGVVVNEQGNPVAGARVIASDNSFFGIDVSNLPFSVQRVETETDSRGNFVVEGIRPVDLVLAVRASGYAPLNRSKLELPDEEEVDLEPLTLTRGVHLSGRVLNSDGLSVAGARLTSRAQEQGFLHFGGTPGEAIATTDDQGYFRVDMLAAGPWKIQVDHPAYPSKSFEGILSEPGSETNGLEFQLEVGALIRGFATGIPKGVSTSVTARAVQTGAGLFSIRTGEVGSSGEFTVEGLEQGRLYSLYLSESNEPGHVFGGAPFSKKVRAESGETGVQLSYLPAAQLSFRVVDSKTGAPIESLTVQQGEDWLRPLEGEDGRRQTEFPGGTVTVADIRLVNDDSRLKVEIESAGYETHSLKGLLLNAGDQIDLGDVALKPVPIYAITVLDSVTRAPIAGARVEANEQTEPVATDQNGGFSRQISVSASFGGGDGPLDIDSFSSEASSSGISDELGTARMNSLGVEQLSFNATASGYARATLDGQSEDSDGGISATLLMSKGGSVLVKVLEADGSPAGGKEVEHRDPKGGGVLTFSSGGSLGGSSGNRTDAAGEVVFENLALGEQLFRIKKGGGTNALFGGGAFMIVEDFGSGSHEEDWVSAVVAEGATVELTLIAPALGVLTGRVTEGGNVLAGASLALKEDKQSTAVQGQPDLSHIPGFGGGGPEGRSSGRGEYSIEDIESGSYILTISHASRSMSTTYPVEVEVGENSFDVDLPISTISGRVTDEAGEPVSGANVSVSPAAGSSAAAPVMMMSFVTTGGGGNAVSFGGASAGADSVITDADGRYSLRGVLPDTSLQVSVTGGTFQPETSDSIEVRPNETLDDIDLVVASGGSVALEVMTMDGDPVEIAIVSATFEGDGEAEPKREVLQEGVGELTGLRPGRWTVTVRGVGFGGNSGSPNPDPQDVIVRAGETAELHFDMP